MTPYLRIDGSKPPPPFGILNVADLRKWRGGFYSSEIRKLVDSVVEKVKAADPTMLSFASPRKDQALTDAHIALIHTCWRTEKHGDEYETQMYMWDLMLYGSKQALDRVQEVTYFLHPSYDIADKESYATNHLYCTKHRHTCFRLRQLAYGHSIARAHVRIKHQIELVRLSRYINLFHTDDRIYDYYV